MTQPPRQQTRTQLEFQEKAIRERNTQELARMLRRFRHSIENEFDELKGEIDYLTRRVEDLEP